MWPMRQFGNVINNYKYAFAAAERIVGLMDYHDFAGDARDGARGRTGAGRHE